MASASSTTQAQAITASWSAMNAGADDHWSTPPSTTRLEASSESACGWAYLLSSQEVSLNPPNRLTACW